MSNFPHMKFMACIYQNLNTAITTAHMQWIVTHYDAIIGDPPSETTYDIMKDPVTGNPNIKMIFYLAYNTNDSETWMEAWCSANGYDPEDIYYHYYSDTLVTLRGGTTYTFYGYGGGSATSLRQARVNSSWGTVANGGIDNVLQQPDRPNFNPTSAAWRRAFEALAVSRLSIATGKTGDGIFLDTFEGTIYDGAGVGLHLENTIEMRAIYGSDCTPAEALAQAKADMVAEKLAMETNVSVTMGKTILIVPNVADYANWFYWFKDFEDDIYTNYKDLWIEYGLSSGKSTLTIPYLKAAYDRMDANPSLNFWVTGDFAYLYTNALNTIDLRQYLIGGHYLVWHPVNKNYYAFVHLGSPTGGYGGVLSGGYYYYNLGTDWHINMEYDIGQPAVRIGTDYWGASNTNRFFTFASGTGPDGGYTILGRNFDNALVLVKIGSRGGIANVGTNVTTHSLGGTYYRLQDDNTPGSAITSIDLGDSHGAILAKGIILPESGYLTAGSEGSVSIV